MILSSKSFNAWVNLFGGQSFLWRQTNNGELLHFSGKFPGVLKLREDEIICYDFSGNVKDYFGDEDDYLSSLRRLRMIDDIMARVVSDIQGVRVLKQDFEEVIFTFIISSNNNLPRIRNSVLQIANRFGRKHTKYGACLYPDAEVISGLSIDELRACGVGYRADFLIESAKIYLRNKNSFENLQEEALVEALKILPGVGDKVADCIAVFSGRANSFSPIDVWAKRILREVYNVEFSHYSDYRKWWRGKFGNDAALAGQILFEYFRNTSKA